MSWSEGRGSSSGVQDRRPALEKVNQVLRAIKDDALFQSDLQDAEVQKALRHWSGEERLGPEEAQAMMESPRVCYAFERMTQIRHVCREAHLAVPLAAIRGGQLLNIDAFLKRRQLRDESAPVAEAVGDSLPVAGGAGVATAQGRGGPEALSWREVIAAELVRLGDNPLGPPTGPGHSEEL